MSFHEGNNPELYFVRHGQYDFYDPDCGLTDEGRDQSLEAALILEGLGFTGSDLVLSSTETRAMQTGEIIAGLFGVHHESDDMLKACGLDPNLVQTFGSPKELVTRIITTRFVGQSVMNIAVVTHQPLVDAVKGSRNTHHGEVVKYAATMWS